MNISISSKTARALVAATALSVAFAGGVVAGRSVDAMSQQQTSVVQSRAPSSAPEFVYQFVDSRQAALDAERAESITLQERVLVGIVAPERIVHVIDDSPAGRMTAMEVLLVATGGR